jgi:hypothetical protein
MVISWWKFYWTWLMWELAIRRSLVFECSRFCYGRSSPDSYAFARHPCGLRFAWLASWVQSKVWLPFLYRHVWVLKLPPYLLLYRAHRIGALYTSSAHRCGCHWVAGPVVDPCGWCEAACDHGPGVKGPGGWPAHWHSHWVETWRPAVGSLFSTRPT